MFNISIRRFLVVLVCSFSFFSIGKSDSATNVQHVKVGLRMIGHKLLLNAGDQDSRVLPVIYTNRRYKVEFSSPLEFEPDALTKTVDSVVLETQLAQHYIVEMINCVSHEVVYSYEVGNSRKNKIVPCAGRSQPKGCYQLWFTILDKNPIEKLANPSKKSTAKIIFLLAGMFLVFAYGLWLLLRKRKVKPNANLIQLGEFQFDKLNMTLVMKEKKIELTSKESDLLLLLHDSVNTTVAKEIILQSVWGDEGDYVGRTLDVFISKLRKKLEFDPKLKILNVRGVGYKLVIGD